MKAVRDGLLQIPPAALRDFLDSRFKVIIGSESALASALKENGLDPLRASSLGEVSPEGNTFAKLAGNRPALMVRTDIETDIIKSTARHEAGHAIDHINNKYRGYSADNPKFERAVEHYLETKKGAPKTEMIFRGDRSFRHDHAPLYYRSEYAREMVAELHSKYSIIATENNPAVAEQFMSRNYPHVWDSLKKDVMPQIEESLKMQGLDPKGRPLSAPKPASPKQPLGDIHESAKRAINTGNWQTSETVDGVRIIRMPIGDMTNREISILEAALKDQGFDPIRHKSGTLGQTIRLAENDVERFEELRKTLKNIPNTPKATAANTPIIGAKQWEDVLDRNDNAAKYLDVNSMTPQERLDLETALKAQGIEYEVKPSSINGGTNVIAITDPDSMVKIGRMQNVETISDKQWKDIVDRNGKSAKYLDVNSMTPQEQLALKNSLKAQGVAYEIKPSSINGGANVIAITDPDSMMKIGRMQDGFDVAEKGQARIYSPKELEALNNAIKDAGAPKAGSGFLGKIAEGLGNLGKRAGLVGGAVIAPIAAGAALLGGASKAEAAQVAVEAAVPYAETAIDLAEGDMAAAAKSGAMETTSTIAGAGGAVAGGVIGQILIPIPGVGAVIGAAVGGIISGVIASGVTEAVIDHANAPKGDEKSFWSRLNPFSGDDKPKQVQETKIAQAPAATPAQNIQPEQMLAKRGVGANDKSWNEGIVSKYYNPERLEAAGGTDGLSVNFSKAHDENVATMLAVYKPAHGSPEYTELQNLVHISTGENFDLQQTVQLNDTFKLG